MKDEKLFCDRIQTKGKFNSHPEPNWDAPLNYLDSIVLQTVRSEKFETPKITKVCVNKKEFYSDSEFDDAGVLRWTYNVENNNSFYTIGLW